MPDPVPSWVVDSANADDHIQNFIENLQKPTCGVFPVFKALADVVSSGRAFFKSEGWSALLCEQMAVRFHWGALLELRHLADPAAPLDVKFDTCRWVFTEREKDKAPFSFVSCLRVVGCSPLSPIPYCGLVDAEEIRDRLRNSLPGWWRESLRRYPAWVRTAVASNPEWVEGQLARDPQCINQQIKHRVIQSDLFA